MSDAMTRLLVATNTDPLTWLFFCVVVCALVVGQYVTAAMKAKRGGRR